MKKCILFAILSIVYLNNTANAADAADWWNQATVCKYDTSRCYTTMGAGFDPEMWDATKGCRGMKYICPNALKQPSQNPELIGINNIAQMINSDFHPDLLGESGDCFGKRRTDGTQVMVNGNYVNLYCHGILNKSDETLNDGEIVFGTQPTCETLKANGYIAVENGKCVGKPIDESKYYIDCGKELLPERLVLLNGAEVTTKNTGNAVTQQQATELFNKMYKVSLNQKKQYFKK